jgi:hypothetical protein
MCSTDERQEDPMNTDSVVPGTFTLILEAAAL